MSAQVDPLRSTLDHLALDPRARSDRPYLETMLRRLGYSEVEIATYLGEHAPPAPEPEPQPRPVERAPLPSDDEQRVIELEYTGPGLRDFQLVVPLDAEFDLDDPLGLGEGLEAGTMTIEGDPDEDELEAFLSGEGAVDLDSEFAEGDEEFVSEADRDNEELGVREEDDDEFLGFDDEDEERVSFGDEDMPGGGHPDDEEFSPEEMAEGGEALSEDASFDPDAEGGEADEPEMQVGRKAITFQAVPMREAKVRRMEGMRNFTTAPPTPADTPETPAPAPTSAAEPLAETAAEDAWPEVDDDAWPEEATWGDEAPVAASDGFVYGDWLLHSREEQREDGSWQRVYFFAKGQSPNGEPSGMPEGYEVAVNEDTQLPYLRPAGEAGDAPAAATAPKKRVRMRRVDAQSAEEAEEQVRGEGRNVLGSYPVEAEGSEDEENA